MQTYKKTPPVMRYLLIVGFGLLLPLLSIAQVTGTWETFPLPGTDGIVSTVVLNEDGSGYVIGGNFTYVEGKKVNHLAQWDRVGKVWTTFGNGVNGFVGAIALYNGAMYVGGVFSEAYNADGSVVEVNNIVRWENGQWYPIGDGVSGRVYTIAVDSLGGVYVGGRFQYAEDMSFYGGTTEVNNVAYWNGTHWEALDNGLPGGSVKALVLYGHRLYVGGDFASPVGEDIARWNVKRRQWEPIGTFTGGSVEVLAFAFPYLFVGGDFQQVDSLQVGHLALYHVQDSIWMPAPVADGTVHDFALGGGRLFLTGEFNKINGMPTGAIAEWNFQQATTSAVPTPLNWAGDLTLSGDFDGAYRKGWNWTSIRALEVNRTGDELFVGGNFLFSKELFSRGVFMLRPGDGWVVPHEGMLGVKGLIQPVHGGALRDEGAIIKMVRIDSTRLAMYGMFEAVGIHRPLPRDTLESNESLAILDLSTGTYSLVKARFRGENACFNVFPEPCIQDLVAYNNNLYLAGKFDRVRTETGVVDVGQIAMYDPDTDTWSPATASYPSYTFSGTLPGDISRILLNPAGLYVGGSFSEVLRGGTTGIETENLAFWNGSWHRLSPGYDATSALERPSYAARGLGGPLRDMTLDVNGHLWAVGEWRGADTTEAPHFAHWDGIRWTRPSTSYPSGYFAQNESVPRLIKSAGNTLFIGAERSWMHVGVDQLLIFNYNGDIGTWVKIPDDFTLPDVRGLEDPNLFIWAWKEGDIKDIIPISPNEAYVAGHFHHLADGRRAEHIAFWDGKNKQWFPLADDLTFNSVRPESLVYDAQVWQPSIAPPTVYTGVTMGNDVYFGGRFDSVSGVPSGNLMLWHGQAPQYANVQITVVPAEATAEGNTVHIMEKLIPVGGKGTLSAAPWPDWYFLGWKVEGASPYVVTDYQLVIRDAQPQVKVWAYFAKMRVAVDEMKLEEPANYANITDPSWRTIEPGDTLVEGNTVRIKIPVTLIAPFTSNTLMRITLRDRYSGDTLLAATGLSDIVDVGRNPVSYGVGIAFGTTSQQDTLVFYWDTDGAPWTPEATSSPLDGILEPERNIDVLVEPQFETYPPIRRSGVERLFIQHSFTIHVRPRPLILVHGLWSNANTWQTFKTFGDSTIARFAVGDSVVAGVMNTGTDFFTLLKRAVKGKAVDFGKMYTATTIADNARQLDTYIEGIRQRYRAQEVDIVAHSMGGLISRYYIQHFMPKNAHYWNRHPAVRYLFTLGTPHLGSPCADAMYYGQAGISVVSLIKNIYTATKAIKSGWKYLFRYGEPEVSESIMNAVRNVEDIAGYKRMNIWQLTMRYGRIFNREVTRLNGVEVIGVGGYLIDVGCTLEPYDVIVPLSSALPARVASMPGTDFFLRRIQVDGLDHRYMTSSKLIYEDIVRPAIDGGKLPATGTLTVQKTWADSVEVPSMHPVFSGDTLVTGSALSVSLDVHVPAKLLSVVITGAPGIVWQLFDPSGMLQDSIHTALNQGGLPGVSFLRASVPTQGTWKLEATLPQGGAIGSVRIGAVLVYPSFALHMRVDSLESSIQGYLQDDSGVLYPADSVIVWIASGDTSATEIQLSYLYDDGAHGDKALGDNIYGAVLPQLSDSLYWYSVIAFADGQMYWDIDRFRVLPGGTSANEEKDVAADHFQIEDLYPLPAKERSTLHFRIPSSGRVILRVYDLLGRQVYVMQREVPSGDQRWSLSAEELSSGLYVIELRYGNRRVYRLWPVVK